LSLLLAQLPADLQARLRTATVAAASERLVAQALAAGFANVTLAAGPLPAQLVRAAHAALMHPASS
jgi:uroporphyrinogen-III synthase